MQAPRHSLRQGDRSPATRWLSAPLKTKLTRITTLSPPPLSPHLMRFVARPFVGRPRLYLVYLLRGRAVKARASVGQDHWSSSHQRLRPSWVKLLQVKLSRVKLSRVKPSLVKLSKVKKQGRFRKTKNNRLIIGKKPPNLMGTEEENRDRKVLIVIQFSIAVSGT